ncbi:hypothetical protein LCGC14_1783210 [marine sediment metagenome]|uniref:Uncharacterized protein n=1 Tax=marine sediment metagenome TaxID=412755 RepID=A0A0F9GUW6_9ZZZZ
MKCIFYSFPKERGCRNRISFWNWLGFFFGAVPICKQCKADIQKNNNINITHRTMLDEDCYQSVKKLYKSNPDIVMKPSIWKKERLKQLKKEGKPWD